MKKKQKKGDLYKFQIGTHETSEDVINRINKIYQKAKNDDSRNFQKMISHLISKIVYRVVEHLQELHIDKIDLDTKGNSF